jgi:hypothetical protein
MPTELEPMVERIAGIVREKSGPAVALRLSLDECADHTPLGGDCLYLFLGWASY